MVILFRPLPVLLLTPLLLLAAAQSGGAPANSKVARVFAENAQYLLFSAERVGNNITGSDYRLWLRVKSTGQARLATDHARFGGNPLVLGAILDGTRAFALVRIGLKDEPTDDRIFEVDLPTGRVRRVFSSLAWGIARVEGSSLLLSPDRRFLSFTADYVPKVRPPPSSDIHYPEEGLFRYGPLGSARPRLDLVPNNSRSWPCTNAQSAIIECHSEQR